MRSPFVSRLLLIVILFAALLPQGSLWAMARTQNAPDAPTVPDAYALQIPLTGAVQIAANGQFTCIITSAGGVKCWGTNGQGQLGDGTTDSRLTPVDVSGLGSGVKAITAGSTSACALLTAGSIRCWGNNTAGQIGDGTQGTNRLTPVAVPGINNAIAISMGEYHTCAILTGGSVRCWGSNSEGQIGDGSSGTTRLTPVTVSGITNAAAIATGRWHTCVVLATGGVKCWGANDQGQLGDGTEDTDRLTPVDVFGPITDAKVVVAGQVNTCVLLTNGSVQCWGAGGIGTLGNNGNLQSNVPVYVYGMTPRGDGKPIGISAIGAGEAHMCATINNDGVKCWGKNSNRQVGDGSNTDRLVPFDVVGLNNAIAVAGGYDHTCAVLVSGGVQCWGGNDFGQLGNNSFFRERGLPGAVTVPATCFALTLGHTGSGSDPAPTPSQSPECPPNAYLPGTQIALVAAPAGNFYVQGWSGSNNDTIRDLTNVLTMPAADHALSVNFARCRNLTLTSSGDGGVPIAVPNRSPQCISGRYAANEIITLLATPAENARVQSWTGVAQSPGAGSVNNALAMPDSNATVNVTYEACVALTAAIVGEGNLLQMTPTATFGCDPSSFIAGQTITLIAAPADGWHVASWIGTTNDQSTDTTNTVVIGNGAVNVGIVYAKDEVSQGSFPLFLPNISHVAQ